ncbi:GNAT family N-acetyltransferase [uncultured Cetobacterium sp.]|uniref:GNAT family N-acetyltransferase n=1 Tax=uncultured Cetobacterium sp. TaxID=527638 RepID=UPI00260A8A81|nr:GNAT family N-acetyltransferase [uncultured Cetobacterium sp.]
MERKEQCKKIWKNVFKDEEKYIEWYFKNIYKDENLLTYEISNEVVGMLNENSYKIKNNKELEEVKYLLAAGVLPLYREQGILKDIMIRNLKKAYVEKLEFQYLSPIDKNIYTRFGYEFISDLYEYEILLDSLKDFKKYENIIQIEKLEDINEELLHKISIFYNNNLEFYNLKIHKNKNNIKDSLKEIFFEDGEIYLTFNKDGEITGYMPLEKHSENLFIKEFLFSNKNSFNSLMWILYGYRNYYKNVKIICGTFDNLEDYFKSVNSIKKIVKNKMQLRIVNLLKAFKRININENESLVIQVKDENINENNGIYKICKDKIERCRLNPDIKISIGNLAQLIYGYRSLLELKKEGKLDIIKNEKLLVDIFIKKYNYFNQDF